MRCSACLIIVSFAIGGAAPPSPANASTSKRGTLYSPMSAPALANATRRTPLSVLDANDTQCRNRRTIAAWLRDLGHTYVRSIRWTGGRCRLERKENAIDAGGARCGQALLQLKRPLSAKDRPMVEVYFESSPGGTAKAYAFRGVVQTREGEEYTRFTADFEAAWRMRFPAGPRGPKHAICRR